MGHMNEDDIDELIAKPRKIKTSCESNPVGCEYVCNQIRQRVKDILTS
jgi:hypothetical protein